MTVPIRPAIWTTCRTCRGKWRSITRCRIVLGSVAPTAHSYLRGICSVGQEAYTTRPMKIVVAVKQVPARDSQLHIAPSGKWIEESDLTYEINEPDAYALEEALQLKEKHGGEVVVLCLGPERAGQTIREALAKGADRAIHIETGDESVGDPLALGRMIAKALESEKPDL